MYSEEIAAAEFYRHKKKKNNSRHIFKGITWKNGTRGEKVNKIHSCLFYLFGKLELSIRKRHSKLLTSQRHLLVKKDLG